MSTFVKDTLAKNKKGIFTAQYAVFDQEYGELTIRDTPWKGSSCISLKNIEYLIKDGILYIKGTRMFFTPLNRFIDDPLNWWSEPNLYNFKDVNLSKHEGVKLKSYTRKSFFGLISKTFDKIYDESVEGYWIKQKKESEFFYSLHPFKLHE